MKLWVRLAVGLCLNLLVHGQGTVDFAVDATLVYDADGTTPLGSSFQVQLYYSSSASGPFIAVTNAPGRFLDGAGAGFWNPGPDEVRVLPLITPGAVAFIQLRAWNGTLAPSYQQAEATGVNHGSSKIFQIVTGGAGQPPTLPPMLNGLESFSLINTPPPHVPPTILSQSQSQSVPAGATVNLFVVANGTSPMYFTWWKNGSSTSLATSSGTNSLYAIYSFSAANTGAYYVVVTNAYGGVVSSLINLSLTNSGSGTSNSAPVITGQSQSQIVQAGAAVTLGVSALGTQPLYFYWRKDGVLVSSNTGTNSLLSIPYASPTNTGVYQVAVSNAFGQVIGTPITLALTNSGSGSSNSAPVILGISTNSSFALGFGFSVSAGFGGGPSTLQWFHDGTVIPGATSSFYSVTNAQPSDAGTYAVVASNVSGSVTGTVTMVSAPIIVTAQPQSRTVAAGSLASFSVSVIGSNPIYYYWQKNGLTLTAGSNSTYAIPVALLTDAGNYQAIISNRFGSVQTTAAALVVTNPPPPVISFISTNVQNLGPVLTMNFGMSSGLFPTLTGGLPTYYQWFHDGVAVPGIPTNSYLYFSSPQPSNAGTYSLIVSNYGGSATGSVFATVAPPQLLPQSLFLPTTRAFFAVPVGDQGNYSFLWFHDGIPDPRGNRGSITITNPTPSDVGSYVVVLTNAFLSITSSVAQIRPPEPAITQQPPEQLVVTTSIQFALALNAVGAGRLSYQWRLNGVPISSATNATLTFSVTQPVEAGRYDLVVSNAYGTIISQSTLIPSTPPVFLKSPLAQVAAQGASVTLAGELTGTPPFRFQWFHDGAVLPSATNVFLALTNLQATDSGAYILQVSNLFDSVTSSPAQLSVVNWSGSGGALAFANSATVGGRVFEADGTTPLNSAYVAQLYYGFDPTNLIALSSAPVPFRDGALAGYWDAGPNATRVLANAGVGQSVYAQVRVWQKNAGPTYALVRAQGGKYGQSSAFQLALGATTNPVPLIGLSSFHVFSMTNRVTLQPGFTFFCNPLANGGNTLAEIIPSLPDQSTLYRFDAFQQAYQVNLFRFGHWDHPTQNLLPGEGAIIRLRNTNSFELEFTGTPSGTVPLPYRAAGYHLIGAVASPAFIGNLATFAFKHGDIVYHFDGAQYQSEPFGPTGWSGNEPTVGAGEAVFILLVP